MSYEDNPADDVQPTKEDWQRMEIHALCERAILALHIHGHAGINKPNFMQCREGLCRDYHRIMEASR